MYNMSFLGRIRRLFFPWRYTYLNYDSEEFRDRAHFLNQTSNDDYTTNSTSGVFGEWNPCGPPHGLLFLSSILFRASFLLLVASLAVAFKIVFSEEMLY
jgi:hypothetical protein